MTHKTPTLKHITLLFIILFIIQCPVVACCTHDINIEHAQDNLNLAQDNYYQTLANLFQKQNKETLTNLAQDNLNLAQENNDQTLIIPIILIIPHKQININLTEAKENYNKALKTNNQAQNFYYTAETILKQAQDPLEQDNNKQTLDNYYQAHNNYNQAQINYNLAQDKIKTILL